MAFGSANPLSALSQSITFAQNFIRSNGWYITFFILAAYVVKAKVYDPVVTSKQFRPSREVDLARVRAAQQEVANRRATEARFKRLEQEKIDKLNSNSKSQAVGSDPSLKKKKIKKTLTDRPRNLSSGRDYNPMDPFGSSSFSSGGYRPPRRNPSRS